MCRIRRSGATALLLLFFGAPGLTSGLPASAAAAQPQAGVGAGQAELPRTEAQARAIYDETVRKCHLLGVSAVRDECLRQANRDLQLNLRRLRAPGTPASGAVR